MIIYYVNQALWLTLMLSAPIVIVTAVIGLILGFLQAVFQLQDQALPFGVKLLAVVLVTVALGGWQAQTLMQFTQMMFDVIASPSGRS